ncbi:hypothetical protein J40TS1_31550 [Paenibacillus montaniterrae]|uniref:Uncharacterized protein n=1 Tax=Paenibacillus montaniterrae TaxID=429341 RepID=A0A920CZI5_9BACL|nr:hypothetical protein J40TS1_31550 [Paenibacillus montaniterrae]
MQINGSNSLNYTMLSKLSLCHSPNSGWVKTNIRKYEDINFNKTLNGWSADEIDSIDINCRISLFYWSQIP